jgi:hypothetical protein
MQAAFDSLAARATKLRERIQQAPERTIPELKFLREKDWLSVAGDMDKLESDEDFSRAMSDLRARAKSVFGEKMRKALRQYAEANGNMLPSDITQLQAYFGEPVDVAALQRYQMAASGSLTDAGRDTILIKEIGSRVDDFDSHFEFSLNGTTSNSGSMIGDALEAATAAYANANGGLLPKTPEQLASYLQQPVEAARMQKFLAEIPPNVTTLEQLKGRH